MTKQSFFKGTLILVTAGLITKLLGFINRIFLSRIIGAEGMGLYQMAVPTLYLVITLTQFGLPIAISKMVAEASAQNQTQKVRAILKVSLTLVSALSIIFTAAMILCAPLIATHLLTDSRAYYALIGIAPIVPIVAVSSVLRGYFQGKQNMIPTASSQVVEQIVRIFTVLFLASYFLPKGVEFAAAAAMVGVVIGEFCGTVNLLYQFRKVKWKRLLDNQKTSLPNRERFDTWRGLLRIAFPVTSGRLIGSLTFWAEPIIVAQSLSLAGMATAEATAYYGQLQGMAIPLMTFPTFFSYSLSVSLVPAIAEAHAEKNWRLVHRRIYQSLRIALIIGAPFTVLLFVFSEPLGEVFYGSANVGLLMKQMVPFFLLLYFQGPLAATLQGLDYAHVAMKNSIYGAVIKTIAIYVLATHPTFGPYGVTLAISMGVVVVSVLHFFSVAKITSFTLELRDILKVVAAMLAMGWTGAYLPSWLPAGMAKVNLLVSAMAGSLLTYFVLLLVLRVLGKQDIQRIPIIGHLLSPFFRSR